MFTTWLASAWLHQWGPVIYSRCYSAYYLPMLVFLGDFKCINDDVCGTHISNFVYWALEMKGEASEHKVINLSTDKWGNWYLIITSTSLWEADTAICWAVDSVAKCQKWVFELCANCMCASGLAVPQLATASLCQVQCQSAFIKDPRSSNVLASVL